MTVRIGLWASGSTKNNRVLVENDPDSGGGPFTRGGRGAGPGRGRALGRGFWGAGGRSYLSIGREASRQRHGCRRAKPAISPPEASTGLWGRFDRVLAKNNRELVENGRKMLGGPCRGDRRRPGATPPHPTFLFWEGMEARPPTRHRLPENPAVLGHFGHCVRAVISGGRNSENRGAIFRAPSGVEGSLRVLRTFQVGRSILRRLSATKRLQVGQVLERPHGKSTELKTYAERTFPDGGGDNRDGVGFAAVPQGTGGVAGVGRWDGGRRRTVTAADICSDCCDWELEMNAWSESR